MPWTTVNNKKLEYPFQLAARAVRTGNEDMMSIVQATKNIFDEATRLNSQVSDLRNENLKLKHENEFMLKLINKEKI